MQNLQMKKSGCTKKAMSVFLLLIVTIIWCITPAFADEYREQELTQKQEEAYFVIVLDCSGSMNQNDPNGLTRTAAEQFVNMLPAYDANLGIVTFGPDYGTKAYNIGRNDRHSQNRVSIAYPLAPASLDNSQKAISVIERETAKNGDFSPLGYAFEAAAKMLEEAGVPEERGAIILLSDGQIEGQDDGQNDNGYDSNIRTVIKKDYESVDNALSIAGSRKWPVYGMELDYTGVNKKGTGYPGVAFYQMREHIPNASEKNQSVLLTSADQAISVFNDIFRDFFKEIYSTTTIKDIVNGKAEESMVLREMTAELTFQVSGDLTKVTRIEITDPDDKVRTFTSKNSGQVVGDVEVTFQKKYASFKIISPKKGTWKITVYGQDNVRIQFDAIAFRKTSLFLSASEDVGKIKSGTEIEFIAQYGHGDERYSSATYYKDNPASLSVNGENVPMTATPDGYKCTYKAVKKGVYKIYAFARNEEFAKGEKRSNSLSFNIDHEPMYTTGLIPNLVLGVLSESEHIRLKDYFFSDSPINYQIIYDTDARALGLSEKLLPDDELVIIGARKKGSYEVIVEADDGTGDPPVSQAFTVTVENKPLNPVSSLEKDIHIVYDANDGSEKARINWDDFFLDPDPVPPYISAAGLEDSGIEMEIDDQGAVFTATKAAKKDVVLTAADASDPTIMTSFGLHITSESSFNSRFGKFKIPVIIAAAILVIALLALLYNVLGKKIYGTWSISLDNGEATESPVEIGKFRSGKGGSCKLNAILNDLGMNGSFGKTRLAAGGKMAKAVYLTDYSGAETIVVDNTDKDVNKKEKIPIRPHSVLYLRMLTGDGITLERIN